MIDYCKIILAFSAFGYVSCLVNQDDISNITIIYPSNLHVYENNDTIRYLITDVDSPKQEIKGTLDVRWDIDNTIDPPTFVPPESLPDLYKVTFTQKYNQEEYVTVIHTSQEGEGSVGEGSVFLHAVNGGEPLWLTTDTTPVYGNIMKIQTVWSPFEITKLGDTSQNYDIDYSILHMCTGSECELHAIVSETQTVNYRTDPKNINIPSLGNFETYQIDYTGSIQPESAIKGIFDFRAFCGPVGTTDVIHYVGSMYIYPKIGPIYIDNTCYYGDNLPVHWVYSIDSTNFDYIN